MLILTITLSAVYPDTVSLPNKIPLVDSCYTPSLINETGLDRLEVWIHGRGWAWDSTVSCWSRVSTKQDSSACFLYWWPTVKQQSEPRLFTSISVLHMEGMKVILYPQDWWIKYWTFLTDTAGNRSCISDTGKVKLIP